MSRKEVNPHLTYVHGTTGKKHQTPSSKTTVKLNENGSMHQPSRSFFAQHSEMCTRYLQTVFGPPDQPGLSPAVAGALFSDNADLRKRARESTNLGCRAWEHLFLDLLVFGVASAATYAGLHCRRGSFRKVGRSAAGTSGHPFSAPWGICCFCHFFACCSLLCF